MADLVLDAAQAWHTLARNPSGRWPSRDKRRNRLEPIATPDFSIPFNIHQGDEIFAIGSCFARNIERALVDMAFRVPVCDFTVPPAEIDETGRTEPLQILNKYTPFAMEQEVRFATSSSPGFSAENCLVAFDDKHFDMQLALGPPVDRERALQRRAQVRDLFGGIYRARLIVLTLGLTETWIDGETGLHLNRPPILPLVTRHPGRFRFEVADIDEVRRSVRSLIDLLKGAMTKEAKIIVTVSPVPLNSTFSGRDVVVANMYSKSVLRAAAEEACIRSDDVFYYPSYESVILSDSRRAFYDDLRHVRDELVRYNTGRLVAMLVGGRLDAASEASLVDTMIQAGRHETAIERIGSALKRHAKDVRLRIQLFECQRAMGKTDEAVQAIDELLAESPLDRGLLMRKGRLLFDLERWREAGDVFGRAADLGEREATYWVGRSLYAVGKRDEARAAFVAVEPKVANHVDAIFYLGLSFAVDGRFAEAALAFERVLKMRPSHAGARARLAEALLETSGGQAAYEHAAAARSISPDSWYSQYVFGRVCKNLGDLTNANEAFGKSLALKPPGRIAHNIEREMA